VYRRGQIVKVYLAGPEVCLPDARDVLDQKIRLTREIGFVPVAPGDLDIPQAPTGREFGENISRIDEQLMTSADAIIANLTPFRGIHADPGTVYELGFMRGRGKPAFAYSNTSDNHFQRLLAYYDGRINTAADGRLRGPDGSLVDDFDMIENLMIDGGIATSGGAFETYRAPDAQRYSDLTAFKAVLLVAAERLLAS
jgi:nucleoside 2-deoxyribosyltransferase